MGVNVSRSALVAFSAQQMFDLVNDIESYPSFMEGCTRAKVLARGDDWVEASLELSKAGISQSFTTRNQLQPPELMTLTLKEGPFKQFHGAWRFQPLGDAACKVTFELRFDLQNPFLGMAVGKLFETMATKQVDAICARARQLYTPA